MHIDSLSANSIARKIDFQRQAAADTNSAVKVNARTDEIRLSPLAADIVSAGNKSSDVAGVKSDVARRENVDFNDAFQRMRKIAHKLHDLAKFTGLEGLRGYHDEESLKRLDAQFQKLVGELNSIGEEIAQKLNLTGSMAAMYKMNFGADQLHLTDADTLASFESAKNVMTKLEGRVAFLDEVNARISTDPTFTFGGPANDPAPAGIVLGNANETAAPARDVIGNKLVKSDIVTAAKEDGDKVSTAKKADEAGAAATDPAPKGVNWEATLKNFQSIAHKLFDLAKYASIDGISDAERKHIDARFQSLLGELNGVGQDVVKKLGLTGSFATVYTTALGQSQLGLGKGSNVTNRNDAMELAKIMSETVPAFDAIVLRGGNPFTDPA